MAVKLIINLLALQESKSSLWGSEGSHRALSVLFVLDMFFTVHQLLICICLSLQISRAHHQVPQAFKGGTEVIF